MVTSTIRDAREQRVWEALAAIPDPEIPAIGARRPRRHRRRAIGPERIHVELLPTFVGCPAIEVMRQQIQERLERARRGGARRGGGHVTTRRGRANGSRRPAASGCAQRLRAAGHPSGSAGLDELAVLPIAECPYCGSRNTTLDNPFGPTLCRAIYHCADAASRSSSSSASDWPADCIGCRRNSQERAVMIDRDDPQGPGQGPLDRPDRDAGDPIGDDAYPGGGTMTPPTG